MSARKPRKTASWYLIRFVKDEVLNEWLFFEVQIAYHAARLMENRWGIEVNLVPYQPKHQGLRPSISCFNNG